MASPSVLLRLRSPLHSAPFFSPSIVLLPARRISFRPVFSNHLSPTLAIDDPFSYGPSLRKGSPLPLPPTPAETDRGDVCLSPIEVDRKRLTRVVDVAALRVPAEHCASLESRLRGHLLNWPRVRNVARVPGDEVDPEIADLLRVASSDDRLGPSLRRARGEEEEGSLSPVLYREKLVKEFNCRGFVRFRNLAKMSRPRKKKKKRGKDDGDDEERSEVIGRGKDNFSLIEVVEVCGYSGKEENEEDGFHKLLGDGFMGGRWRGSTRLLLLDERFASRCIEQLPEAVKVD